MKRIRILINVIFPGSLTDFQRPGSAARLLLVSRCVRSAFLTLHHGIQTQFIVYNLLFSVAVNS
jgi:tRNA pseudouridine-54 N-methylase